MQYSADEHAMANLTVAIFDQESPKLVDKDTLPKRWAELYDKSLFMGIGTAVTFIVAKGDSLSFTEQEGLSQGKIPDCYAEEGFERLLTTLPEVHENEDDFNFCFCWFYAGIGVAVAFIASESFKQVEPPMTNFLDDTINQATRCEPSDGEYLIDFVAAELKRDMTYLSELGIKLDKGQLAAKTGGVAWAGYEAFTGDWLSALVVGGISLLVGGLTNGYKRIKVVEMQQKWKDRLSDLNQDQLEYLAEGLQRKHPLLMRRFQNILQAG